MALYESEHTLFMREMMAKNPAWAEDQLVGRALLWDRNIDEAEQRAIREAQEANKPYPYDVNFDNRQDEVFLISGLGCVRPILFSERCFGVEVRFFLWIMSTFAASRIFRLSDMPAGWKSLECARLRESRKR